MSRERSSFARHTLHQVSIAANRVDIEIENVESRTVEILRQPFTGNGHAHAIPCALAERPRRCFDSGGEVRLGMPRSPAVDLPESLDLLHGDGRIVCNSSLSVDRAHSRQVKRGVEKHRGVPGGQNETVTIWPGGIRRIVAEEALPQRVDHRRQTHGGAGVT